MLTVTLKKLDADGLVKRTLYPQVPPRVEYQLTERGRSLLPLLQGLVDWANENMPEIQKSREQYQAA
jgi:DNA-binding HxlR family transcriptional regulator